MKAGRIWQTIWKPPWRTFAAAAAVLLVLFLAYALWSPGAEVTDGRHDLKRNGIWLQHGWLGDDDWFVRNKKEPLVERFREPRRIRELAALLRKHHVTDVFPHLCPTARSGAIPHVDAEQTKRFLREFAGFRVMPWVGGARDVQAFPDKPEWRATFAESIRALLIAHSGFSGAHINIEPCRSGSSDFLAVLDEVRAALPEGKILSVAAYPPPTRWQPVPEVHWEEGYYRAVAGRVDQLVVMMYDTALRFQKPYRRLMASWTVELLDWAEDTPVLLGLPAYGDESVGYHHPAVENLQNALAGIHAGLLQYESLPTYYHGVALYCEWEMDDSEWRYYRQHFLKQESPVGERR